MVLIRHCVEESNVDPATGYVIDPTKIRHVTIVAKKIHTMSGNVDPASHLNLDLPHHAVTQCVIAKKFEVGAEVLFAESGLALANLRRDSYRRYGSIDYTTRLTDMVDAVSKRLEKKPLFSTKSSKKNYQGRSGAADKHKKKKTFTSTNSKNNSTTVSTKKAKSMEKTTVNNSNEKNKTSLEEKKYYSHTKKGQRVEKKV